MQNTRQALDIENAAGVRERLQRSLGVVYERSVFVYNSRGNPVGRPPQEKNRFTVNGTGVAIEHMFDYRDLPAEGARWCAIPRGHQWWLPPFNIQSM